MEKLLLSVPEAAEVLNLGRTLVYQLIVRGELRSVRVGRRRLVPVDALQSYVARLQEGGLS